MTKYLLILSSVLLLTYTFSSCSKPMLEEGKNSTEKSTLTKKTVTLSLAQETSPMRGEPNNVQLSPEIVYGINVYAKKSKDTEYSKYAYGLFTDPSKITLELPEINTYKFECIAIQDYEDKLFHENLFYEKPFLHGDQKPTEATNTFIYSTSENLCVLKEGYINIMKQKEPTKFPCIYKYYGFIEDYKPTSNILPEIYLKKLVYGLHFKIKPPKEGTIEISYNNNEEYIKISAQDTFYDHSYIQPFTNKLDELYLNKFDGKLILDLKWTKADGTVYQDQKTVDIIRNTMHNISIEVSGPDPKQCKLKLDNDEMKQKDIEWHFKIK